MKRTTPWRSAQGGFTLIEMMVVVAIIGILTTLAAVSIRSPQGSDDTVSRLAARVRECSRLAVSHGPVRADVLSALGSRTRARMVLAPQPDGSQLLTVELLVEDELPSDGATWASVSRSLLTDVKVEGTTDSSVLTAGSGPGTPITTDHVLQCYPTGAIDPMTYYVARSDGGGDRSRLVVMSMTGEPIALARW